MDAKHIINRLKLQPHPEGGYFRETYRAQEQVNLEPGQRNVSTSIYYLLENTDKSHLHRVAHDEIWYFHQGEPLEILTVGDEKVTSWLLGNDLSGGQVPQLLIEANTWFAARLQNGQGYSLVSCSVSPGFDFRDFELAGQDQLNAWPEPMKEQLRGLVRGN